MEAFVTGATGFIGGHVARALLARGWSVRCLARSSSRRDLSEPGVRWIDGDLSSTDDLAAAMAGCDAVFHAAAYYSLWDGGRDLFRETNVEGTRRVLEAARAAGGLRVVYTSSVSCVGEAPPDGLADEDTEVRPGDLCGEYKRSKHEAERVALERAAAGDDVVVVNPASVIGPGDHKPTPTGRIVLDFLEGRMPVYLDTGLNFVDVRDVAEGHVLAFHEGRAGRRYILGNREGNKSLREFLEVVARVAGRRPPRFRIPYQVAWLAGTVSTFVADRVTGREPGVPINGVRMARHRMYFDPSRAIAELGLPQTPLEQTVADAVDWFRRRAETTAAAAAPSPPS